MEVLQQAWAQYAHSLADIPSHGAFGISAYHLAIGLNSAWLLRLSVTFQIHWLRLLLTHMLLVGGGRMLIQIMLGQQVPFFTDPTLVPSVLLANFLMFHCPGDVFAPIYRRRHLRIVWQVAGALQTVQGSVGAIQAVSKMNDHLPSAAHLGPLVLLFAGVLGAIGGGLIVEWTNALLLPITTYMRPKDGHGPALNAIMALLSSTVYLALITPLSHFPLLGLVLPYLPYLSDLTSADKGLLSKLDAKALTALVILILSLNVPGRVIMARASALFSSIPGFKPVLVPDALNDDDDASAAAGGHAEPAAVPWPLDVGLFGYDYNPKEGEAMEATLPNYLAADEDEEVEEEEEAPSPKPKATPASVRKRAGSTSAASPKSGTKGKSPARRR